MRPDCREWDREGRLPGRAYSCRGDKGRAARRQDLHHSGIRWPCRNGVNRVAQSALARTGQGHARRQGWRTLERQDHAAVPAVHRDPRNLPEIESISSLQPDYHGGNMDLPDVAPGAILYFPVHIKGGFLYVGDCHAAQGDGELSGVAIEQRATVTLQVDVIKGWSFAWPRLENEKFVMTIGSARPLEDAARIAYRELVRWMSAEYGFDEIDAYMLLSQAGRIRLGNMVDPKYTIGASILKKYLV